MSMPTEKSLQNLAPTFGELDPERAREIRAMGGKARGEQRRRNKNLRDAFKAMQEVEIPRKSGGSETASDAIALALMQKAVKGDLKAIELLWEILYGKQTKIDVTSSDKSMSPGLVNLGDRTPEELMAFFKTLKEGTASGAGPA